MTVPDSQLRPPILSAVDELIPRGAVLLHPDVLHVLMCATAENVHALTIELSAASMGQPGPLLYRTSVPCQCDGPASMRRA